MQLYVAKPPQVQFSFTLHGDSPIEVLPYVPGHGFGHCLGLSAGVQAAFVKAAAAQHLHAVFAHIQPGPVPVTGRACGAPGLMCTLRVPGSI